MPILGLTENTDSVPALRFAVASRRPSGLNATDSAPDRGPVENGEPATGVNAPVVGSTENTDTLSPEAMVASRSPLGLKATAPASVPNGEPGTALNAPVPGQPRTLPHPRLWSQAGVHPD